MSTYTDPEPNIAFGDAAGDPGLTALVDAARDLAAPCDLPSLLAILARHGRLLLGAAVGFVAVLDDEEPDLAMIRAVDGLASGLGAGVSLRGPDLLGVSRLADSGLQWIPDSREGSGIEPGGALAELARAEELRALIAVRLGHGSGRFGKRPFGVLYLAYRRVRTFTAYECALLASLADLAGAAIEKVRLLDLTVARLCGLENTTARTTADLSAVRALGSTHFEFIELVVGGGSPQALVDEAGRRLGGLVTLYAADGTAIAASDSAAARGIEESQRTPALTNGWAPVVADDHTWTVPVLAGDRRLATLVIRAPAPLDAQDRELLPLIGQAAAVLLRQESGAAGEHSRQELLSALLNPALDSARQLAGRARRLGLDLDRPHTVVTLRPEGAAPARAAPWAVAQAHREGGLAGVHDEDVVMLLPGPGDPAELARTVAADASAFLGCPVTAAAAGPGTGPEEIVRSHGESVGCLRAMSALGLAGRGVSAAELGFLSVLLSGRQGVDTFVNSIIGPVVEYDLRRFTDLFRTLEAYFAADASPSGAAEFLHVHPNTVARRLERVKKLLGPDWQRPPRALEIQLALRLVRLRERP